MLFPSQRFGETFPPFPKLTNENIFLQRLNFYHPKEVRSLLEYFVYNAVRQR